MLQRWKERAERLKRTLFALYLAARHPGTPWYARALAAAVVAYAFSPIDLIPDPIPLLGYLDDLVLLPAGIWLALRLIPEPVWKACQAEAQRHPPGTRPRGWVAAGVIVLLWLLAAYLCGRLLWPILHRRLAG